MQYKAKITNGVVAIYVANLNNASTLSIPEAAALGSELDNLIANCDAPDVSTPTYHLLSTPTGLTIQTLKGSIDIPWRWLASIAADLDA